MLIKIRELNDESSPYYDLGIKWHTIDLLEKYNILQKIEIDKFKYIELNKLLEYIEWEKNIVDNYLIDLEAWEILGTKANKDTLRTDGIKKLISLAKLGYIEMIELDHSLITVQEMKYKRVKRLFKKSSVKSFSEKYINLIDAAELMNKSLQYVVNILKSKNVEIIKLAKKYNLMFVKKQDVIELIESGKDSYTKSERQALLKLSELPDYINKEQSCFILGVSTKSFKRLCQSSFFKAKQEVISNRVLYNKNDIFNLKNHKEKWELHFVEKHLTTQELLETLGFHSSITNLGKETLNKLVEDKVLKKVELNESLIFIEDEKYKRNKIFFEKDSVELFITDFIKIDTAAKLLKRNLEGITKYFKLKNIPVIRFSSKNEYSFVQRSLILELVNKKNNVLTEEEKLQIQLDKSEFLNKKQVMQYLNLTNKRIAQFIDKNLLKVEIEKDNNLTLFSKQKVLALKEKQDALKKILNDKWYTRNEIIDIYNNDPDKHEIRKIRVPILVASDKRFLNKRVVYLKKSVEEH